AKRPDFRSDSCNSLVMVEVYLMFARGNEFWKLITKTLIIGSLLTQPLYAGGKLSSLFDFFKGATKQSDTMTAKALELQRAVDAEKALIAAQQAKRSAAIKAADKLAEVTSSRLSDMHAVVSSGVVSPTLGLD